jgi:hypothetical protein
VGGVKWQASRRVYVDHLHDLRHFTYVISGGVEKNMSKIENWATLDDCFEKSKCPGLINTANRGANPVPD